jgi:hypothetical protein
MERRYPVAQSLEQIKNLSTEDRFTMLRQILEEAQNK